MKKYKSKYVSFETIEAIQFEHSENCINSICNFVNKNIEVDFIHDNVYLKIIERDSEDNFQNNIIKVGDYIIRTQNNEIHVLNQQVFEDTFKEII